MSNGFHPRVEVGASTFYEHLRSPHGLSEQQRSEIAQLLHLADKDIEDYDTEIVRLENKLAYLKSQRERLKDHKSTLNSLLSPIHRLPNELLTRIFAHVCRDLERLHWMKMGKALDISAVCTRWRSSAISTSELWASLNIWLCDEKAFNAQYNSQLEFVLDVYLERSKQQLLTMHIDAEAWTSNTTAEHPLLRKVIDSSNRWEHVVFTLSIWDTVHYPSLSGLDLPVLQTASFQATHQVDLNLLASAPMLHTLAVPALDVISTESTAFKQLTGLRYTVNDRAPYTFLDMCPKLRSLDLTAFPLFGSNPVLASPTKASIASLSVYLDGYAMSLDRDPCQDILARLSTPSLATLELKQNGRQSFSDYPTPEDEEDAFIPSAFNAIDGFLARSQCPLTVLVIDGLPTTDKEMVAILKRLCSLVELTVADPRKASFCDIYPVSKAFVESLHSHRRSALQTAVSPLVPLLRSLTLTPKTSGFDHESFISTIASRWLPDKDYASRVGVSCLRSVELLLPEPVDEAKYQPLLHYEKSGMRIVVKQREE